MTVAKSFIVSNTDSLNEVVKIETEHATSTSSSQNGEEKQESFSSLQHVMSSPSPSGESSLSESISNDDLSTVTTSNDIIDEQNPPLSPRAAEEEAHAFAGITNSSTTPDTDAMRRRSQSVLSTTKNRLSWSENSPKGDPSRMSVDFSSQKRASLDIPKDESAINLSLPSSNSNENIQENGALKKINSSDDFVCVV